MTIFALIVFSHVLLYAGVNGDVTSLGKSISEFGFNLYKELAKENQDGNIFFSPQSVSTALAMTYLGARNSTAAKMKVGLCLQGFPDNSPVVHQTYHSLLASIEESNKQATFKSANKLFGQIGFKFLDKFLSDVTTFYNAPLKQLNFAEDTEGSRKYINAWVYNETEQKIQDLLPKGSIDGSTVLVLANAVFFKGSWMYKFNSSNTKSLPFHVGIGTNKTLVNVDMMYSELVLNWTGMESLKSQMIELPYKTGSTNDTSMYIIMPETAEGMTNLEKQLDANIITKSIQMMSKAKIHLSLPRFHLTQHQNLKTTLSGLGMGELFSGEADLSGMDGRNDLYMSSFQHKAFVNVTEEGTVAAAASGGIVNRLGPIPFTVNRPFIFFIRDKISGAILFLGRMSCVTGKAGCV